MHTSVGKLREVLASHQHEVVEQSRAGTRMVDAAAATREVLSVLEGAAHYVVDDRVARLVSREGMERSFRAMVDAGVEGLPFDPILLEYQSPLLRGRSFVRLSSQPLVPVQLASENHRPDLWAYPVVMSPAPGMPDSYVVAMAQVDGPIPVIWNREPGPAYIVYYAPGKSRLDLDLSLEVSMAMSLAMLMLNTRGVETEHVSMERLDRQRRAQGRLPIGDYSVVRIGHIYDREGRAHSVGGSGRHMPVHWRAAHVRNMRFGPAGPRDARVDKETRPTRPSYIPPCLVNYDPGEREPAPRQREVRA